MKWEKAVYTLWAVKCYHQTVAKKHGSNYPKTKITALAYIKTALKG